ncbi:MAG: cytochrome b [Acidimicrobiales bacterium]
MSRRSLIERAIAGTTDRLGAGHGFSKAMRKVFPSHFSFLWGEIALYSLVVLIITGVFLTFLFEPTQQPVVYEGEYHLLNGVTMSAAYRSVIVISHDTRGGLLIRQTHHWAALVFVAAIIVHLGRVFFTGAYRRPRDLNWLVGCCLLLLALGAGFTGYSLPDDLLSGTGLRITDGIMLSIPLIGERLSSIVFGGEWPGQDVVGRVYPVHVMIIPALIVVLLAAHLGIVWRQKHTQFPGPGRTEDNVIGEPVWPRFAMKSIGLMFITAGVITTLGALLTVNPVWHYGPYAPGAATSFAQPDWYIGFLEGAVRLFPPWELRFGDYQIPAPFFGGVVVAGVIFGTLFAVPYLDRRITGDHDDHNLLERPRDAAGRTAAGVAGLSVMVLLFLGGAQDVVAGVANVSVGHVTTALQIGILVVPPLAWYVTRQLCRSLARRPPPGRTERSIVISRSASGGYDADAVDDPEADLEAAEAGR